jgi:hypothetical protein
MLFEWLVYQRRSQRMNSVESELICGIRQVVIYKFTQYFHFLQHVLRGFAKNLWSQLTPQLVVNDLITILD